jgi:LytR cell envelope-related transcriptional attenuator
VVAQITEGTAFDKHGRPFRRRNPRPAIIAIVLLVVATGAVWTAALTRPAKVHEVAACNPPPPPTGAESATMSATATPTQLGEKVSRSDMSDVTPGKLADAKIRVLNASGRGGQAGDVAGALKDLGFSQPAAANDPIYAGARLSCQGQIRFGTAGQAAAAALWLVAPCTELWRDNRSDDSVDLVLGTDFSSLAHNDDIDSVLATLKPGATEPSDSALLVKVHANSC